ncbi:BTB/POZ domain-containing protein 1-like [Paramacrobiotus metropolitanus]|uniref:BTB/POZ domain-containing protein 1-like n=1 Tax=Paramacrobiotus metropolitanus TaxID=2943436 RepID=UPI00244608E4|nr:BTB/POZ domain-containing protein 1-like [Paramacrobiotus metropolitanus]
MVAMCADFILKELSVSNCLEALESAVRYSYAAPGILEKCLCLIYKSSKTVWESEQFCAIGQDELHTILQRDSLTASEDIIWSSVDKWATNMCKQKHMEASSANRREMLGPMLFLIRFPLLTDTQLLDGPVQTGLLLQSEAWDIYHYKHADVKPPLPFPTEPRQYVDVEGVEGVINYTIPDVRMLAETTSGNSRKSALEFTC